MVQVPVKAANPVGVPEIAAGSPSSSLLHPSDAASPGELLRLADEYRSAAVRLLEQGRKGDPVSRAPCRLVAVHAIELYLNAFLRVAGTEAKELRKLQHNLAARARMAFNGGLVLRKKTQSHLAHLTDGREYIVTRYAPQMSLALSQINRLMATMEELANKVQRHVRNSENPAMSTSVSKTIEQIAPPTAAGPGVSHPVDQ